MISADEIFMEQREHEMTDEDVNFLHQKDLEEQQMYEEDKLPIIDMNTIEPRGDVQMIDLGGETPELVNTTSLELGNRIASAIVEGHINPLDFIVKKKLLEHAMAVAFRNPDVKAMAEEEIAKYPKNKAKVLGTTVSVMSRRKYSYSEDPTWKGLKESIRPIEEKIKDQEKLVQAAVKSGLDLVDHNSGEIVASVVSAPESKSIAVSFKKK